MSEPLSDRDRLGTLLHDESIRLDDRYNLGSLNGPSHGCSRQHVEHYRQLADAVLAASERPGVDRMAAALERAKRDIIAAHSGNPAKWPNLNETIAEIDSALVSERSSVDPIEGAWSAANAVLPGVFWVQKVTHVERMDPPNNFVAKAINSGPLSVDKYHGVQIAYGDSPTEALRNLTLRLVAIRDGEEKA